MDAKEVIEHLIKTAPRGIYFRNDECELSHDSFTLKDLTYIVVHPDVLRKWIAGALHRSNLQFIPKNRDIGSLPTHQVLSCSCEEYWEEIVIDADNVKNMLHSHNVRNAAFDKHVEEAIQEMTVEYQEDWSDLK